jgi:hypothetical protein
MILPPQLRAAPSSAIAWLRKKQRSRVRKALEAVQLVRAFNLERLTALIDEGAEVGDDDRRFLSALRQMENALRAALKPAT